MKSKNKILIVLLVIVLLAVTFSLPFGVNILQREGFEGVWNRKKQNMEKVVPGSEPVMDKALEIVTDKEAE